MASKITFYKEGECIFRYTVAGHANSAPHGEDLVCAALSVLTQNTFFSLMKLCDFPLGSVKSDFDEKKGWMDIQLPCEMTESQREKSQLLLESLELGISTLQKSYPDFIELSYRRCE